MKCLQMLLTLSHFYVSRASTTEEDSSPGRTLNMLQV